MVVTKPTGDNTDVLHKPREGPPSQTYDSSLQFSAFLPAAPNVVGGTANQGVPSTSGDRGLPGLAGLPGAYGQGGLPGPPISTSSRLSTSLLMPDAESYIPGTSYLNF